jgi:4-hydroxy-tetrahydrodipicolinate synthase
MKFAGVIPILPTPFHDDERLDLASWRRMLEFMAGIDVDGVTILGVLGESNRLNDEERERLIATAVEVVGQRIPIIVGTSHSGTSAATYLSRRAQDLGASAVMVTPAKEPVPNDETHHRDVSPDWRRTIDSDRLARSSGIDRRSHVC